MELLLHQWGDWPELYRNTDKTEATEIVIIDSQMNYRGKLDTYRGLGLFAKGLLSSVACGDTFFQRKKAPALRYAALVTLRVFPQR